MRKAPMMRTRGNVIQPDWLAWQAARELATINWGSCDDDDPDEPPPRKARAVSFLPGSGSDAIAARLRRVA